MTCEYVSMVNVIEECPSADWTTAGCTFADNNAVAYAWRRPWSVPSGNPACLTIRRNSRLRLSGVDGRAVLHGEDVVGMLPQWPCLETPLNLIRLN